MKFIARYDEVTRTGVIQPFADLVTIGPVRGQQSVLKSFLAGIMPTPGRIKRAITSVFKTSSGPRTLPVGDKQFVVDGKKPNINNAAAIIQNALSLRSGTQFMKSGPSALPTPAGAAATRGAQGVNVAEAGTRAEFVQIGPKRK